jgi:YfiH family protein
MKQLFYYLGDMSVPYRTIMANHSDFVIHGITIQKKNIVIAEQTHSNHMHICQMSDCGAGFDKHAQIADCDALTTNLTNQFLLIRTADCTPVLFYDKNSEAIGAVHSGREGTRKNIIRQLVKAMQSKYQSNPGDIQVWIGAGICKNHYQVSPSVWQEFAHSCRQDNIIIDESDEPFIDVQDVILQQLLQSGIRPENIKQNQICTYESEAHFSFRRDGTNNRQINLIGLIDG